MICPACNNPMIVVEYRKIELDFCPVCHGAWFDTGELELFLENPYERNQGYSLQDFFTLPDVSVKEKAHRCPICHVKMQKASLGEPSPVIIDICQKNRDGLFFDGGELNQLISQILPRNTGKEHPVLHFLNETLKAIG